MHDLNLFLASDGSWITSSDLRRALEASGAGGCPVLYIHTGMTFGLPNLELPRTRLLDHLHQLLQELGAETLCLPAFTFSFCAGEAFDVARSRSRMGALNEHLRLLPGAARSVDPLMSNVVLGPGRDLILEVGRHSVGAGSTFDRLHAKGKDVKFLFFGTTPRECFTYTHYVEERLDVPYRYRRPFKGRIQEGDRSREETYTLFVRYAGVVPADDGLLQSTLLDRGHLRWVPCGDSSISCVGEPEAWETIREHLTADVHAYIAHDPMDRDTTFPVARMVAL
ncbi:AAC(3) family N-acetyltransferase [Mesoterricola sediminis]|uniref:Aminoglycoside N(3)-acetyltransferase n=1 Tax=Mesoterricola sediminis TaxID=2927980 RepID=A0AA48GSX8_9BACT|nr:AAC(3) family N-acetyltransferase [Mesoterricola sediminis]BDU78686.1 hypothetical protein METESE_36440 [Mesoterricola sediminis]